VCWVYVAEGLTVVNAGVNIPIPQKGVSNGSRNYWGGGVFM
jgi:hypothetical protein